VDLADIELCGSPLESVRVADFRPPPRSHSVLDILPLPTFMIAGVRRALTARPEIDPKLCIACNRCKDGCPVVPSAIDPARGQGGVDTKTCIRCYCCHEFCPVKAIHLRRSWVDRVFRLNALAEWLARTGERWRARHHP
jgi:formate hydrogenlyase subunit 6/NADH:ubiquinone oxidoreductase subunit I